MLMQSFPKETHFVIISNDTDLDHDTKVINFLQAYCSHLITHKNHRPTKESTLINSIKNKFKNESPITEHVYKQLLTQAVIKITDGKVNYNDTKIHSIANS